MGTIRSRTHERPGAVHAAPRGMRRFRLRPRDPWAPPGGPSPTPEAFIEAHGLAPAIEYARERVRAAFGEARAVVDVAGEFGDPYLTVEFLVPWEEEDPATLAELRERVAPLLDLEQAIMAEICRRFGSEVHDALFLAITPSSPAAA